MSDKTYKVVFSGNLALDTDEKEARINLEQKCRYQPAAIEKILSGRKVILKKGLDEVKANRYKNYFDQFGLLCDVIAETSPAARQQTQTIPQAEPTHVAPPAGRTCPKCFSANQTEDTCQQCGVIFARYEAVKARRAAMDDPDQARPEETTKTYFEVHPEQLFILKAFAVISLIILVQELLSNFLPLFMLLFPVVFLLYIRLQATVTGQSATQLLSEHITFMPVMYAKEERQQQYIPLVTYGLILANILIFYLFELSVSPELISNNLIFLPYAPTPVNVPLSLFTSLFLHSGQGHLWGNMLFLWAVGTMVERRIGPWRLFAFYLISGICGNLLYLLSCQLTGSPAHILGASGAIAGVMGIFAVRCYFKSMVFPLPILGIFSLILPVSLKIRLNSLVIIGLFFLADLSGGIEQVQGSSSSNVGHWAHIGGILCGTLLAMMFRINKEAILERHIELGSQAVNAQIGAGDLEKGEESLRLLLTKDPENTEALLLLARLRSKFTATEEGNDLYRKVIPKLILENQEEAMMVFHEYYKVYYKGLDSDTMFRLANIYHRNDDLEAATQCLESVCQNKLTPPAMLERALFQCARILESMDHINAASMYYRDCIEKFPDSPLSTKATSRLEHPKFAGLQMA
ncbi:rhomboid family intramembrane serine protease [Pelobacter seleniigenes]|uniref:rhomboid family intramembrane serine protease n=1 Tax=Pelobacter seleniigenes TaxID=407188 RepID=UPI000690AA16|nr:rhomboid family intramembrane serine protease [Pelobacter seleniigenes]